MERRKTIRKLVNISMNLSLFETTEEGSVPIKVEGDIVDIAINGLCLRAPHTGRWMVGTADHPLDAGAGLRDMCEQLAGGGTGLVTAGW